MGIDEFTEGKVVSLEGRHPSDAVVNEVAELAAINATDLPPLVDVVDPDALNTIFANAETGTVIFEYYRYTITIEGNKLLSLQQLSPES